MLADELLADARRIFQLEAESKRVNSELARAKADYSAKVAKLTNGDAAMILDQLQRNGTRNGGAMARQRGRYGIKFSPCFEA